MQYQALVHLNKHLEIARASLPKKQRIDALASIGTAVDALDRATGVLKKHRLVIAGVNVRKLIAPTIVSLKEYQNADDAVSRSDRKGVIKNARQRVRQAHRLVRAKVHSLQTKTDKPPPKEPEIPIEERITSFTELAELMERNRRKQQQKEEDNEVTAAQHSGQNRDLESAEDSLNRYTAFRRRLPKRVRSTVGYEIIEGMPILLVPDKPIDFDRLRRSNLIDSDKKKLKHFRIGSGVVFENQLVVAWNPRGKKTYSGGSMVQKAIDFIVDRTGVKYQQAETSKNTTYFLDTASPLRFAWLIPEKLINALQVPIKSVGFPFSHSEVTKDIDIGELKEQHAEKFKELYPDLADKVARAKAALKLAEKEMSYFDRSGQPNELWDDAPEDERPNEAFYDDYKADLLKARKRMKAVEEEYKKARARVSRILKRGK